MLALVGAAVDSLPPKLGDPKTMPAVETENETPAVISVPPIVSIPLLPLAIRTPKAGLVRFKPVALFGSVSISAVAMPFAETAMERASVSVETLPKYVVPKSVLAFP